MSLVLLFHYLLLNMFRSKLNKVPPHYTVCVSNNEFCRNWSYNLSELITEKSEGKSKSKVIPLQARCGPEGG